MSKTLTATETLIDTLTRDLRPVRPLRTPAVRALLWLAVVVGLGTVFANLADLGALARRLAVAPDMWLAVVGSTLTALTASIAVFQLSVPDRRVEWAWLPLPFLMLWVGASGAGCLRTGFAGGQHGFSEFLACLKFTIEVSFPLSVLLIVMLRRGYVLRPGLVATVGGLAVASAAATLLNFFHPYDAAAMDLLVHLVAIALVVGANGVLGGQILQPTSR